MVGGCVFGERLKDVLQYTVGGCVSVHGLWMCFGERLEGVFRCRAGGCGPLHDWRMCSIAQLEDGLLCLDARASHAESTRDRCEAKGEPKRVCLFAWS